MILGFTIPPDVNQYIRRMAPRMRFVQVRRIDETLELMLPKKPVFKTGAVIRAWLPRLSTATVGNAF